MSAPDKPPGAGADEAGWTLVEVVVLVAIVALIAAAGGATLAQRPAQAATTATAFAGLVTEARALASVTGDGASGAGTGASIGVVREGRNYVATLYTYRPMAGAAQVPVETVNVPPLRTTTKLAIATPNGFRDAPFAIFFSASGHAVARAPFTIGVDAPLAAEPTCPLRTGIAIAFIDGVHDRVHALSCEAAQLDLDTVDSAAPGR